MGRQKISVPTQGAFATGVSRRFRNRLALTTILAMAPFMGYGRQANAACPAAPPFVCTGDATANTTTQLITYDNANVSTAPGFGVNAAAGNGITITGEGHLQFTDVNASPITGPGNALDVRSSGDDLATNTPGAVTINVNGTLTGGDSGIYADNQGSGDVHITANGSVSGSAGDGIYGRNYGGNLTIITGADSEIVSDGDDGIDGVNQGTGNLSITANGSVSAFRDGIVAYNSANGGTLEVTVNGEVNSETRDGVYALNYGTGLTITTAAGSSVSGGDEGIDGVNKGSGNLTITANGTVNGSNDGILAYNENIDGDITLTTGVQSVVTGGDSGIDARNYSSLGDMTITANGKVTGQSVDGIYAYNYGTDLTISTGAGSEILGNQTGITATSLGYGDLTITVEGKVTGTNEDGIVADNSNYGDSLIITTGAASSVKGWGDGIDARNEGEYDLKITANGTVEGENGHGINAYNSYYGTNLTVVTGAASSIKGATHGIHVKNYGFGDLDITANGAVTGTNGDGIYAVNSYLLNYYYGVNLSVRTGAGSNVTGGDDGIEAVNLGTGNLTVTADGFVEGKDGEGIQAYNSEYGVNLVVTTGAASVVKGNDDGIDAVHHGSGNLNITVNGEATGTDDGGSNGIETGNYGAGVTNITVGAGGLAQGFGYGIFAGSFDSQNIFITNNGLVQNLSGATDGYAIGSRGGVVQITNNNTLIGVVTLDPDEAFDDTLNNNGLWNSTNGQSDFGLGDNDTLNNSGRIQAAADPLTSEATVFAALEHMNNSGVVSMIDGDATDRLDIGLGTEYVGQGGKLAVDGLLAPNPTGESDYFRIIGNSSGVTDVVVNLLDPNGSTPNFDGIPVVEVTGDTTEGNFRPEGGVLNAGFFAWHIRLDEDGHTHELYTAGLGAGSYEFAAGITGAQDLWYQTTGTLLQRQADLRTLLAGTQVTPVADFTEPVEPTPVGRVTPGLWFKGVGGYVERDQDVANNAVTDRNQEIYGIFGGFDVGSESAGEAWLFGVFGGYVTSDLDFDQTNTKWDYEGPSVGAYATYLDEAFHADLTVKADFLDVDIDASDIAPATDNVDSDVFNLGGRIDAGYKMPIGNNLFIDPQATLAVLYTEVDDIGDVMGGSVDFEDETSVRGRLGLRLGHELTASDQVIYSSDVTASVWQEFAGSNDVTVTAPLTDPADLSDNVDETYGDVALGFSVQSPEGWSSFIRANYQFSDDYDAFAGNAGVRYAW